jgi:DNA processing protein
LTLSDLPGISAGLVETARTIRRGEAGYPAALARVAAAPEALRVRGELGAPPARVAIVGARKPDAWGTDFARRLACDLAKAGASIVSGGAAGIDTAAHEGALDGGGHTVAVMGTGLDVVFPAANRGLFERIVASGGALVSEYADERPGAPWQFPERNRIVSGMSEAVVVVRAGRRSGALLTAAHARAQGVAVLAVPGQPGDPLAEGPNGLLRGGARVATGAEDVLRAVGLSGQLALPVAAPAPRLEGDLAALWAVLGSAPRHADELAREAGLGPGAAMAALLRLELDGLCEARPGQQYLRRA